MIYRILVSAYTDFISTLTFDPATSALEVTSIVSVGQNPSWITFNPASGDHSLVWTGLERIEGKILALKYDANGQGRIVAEAPSEGDHPCSLFATEDQLIIANYSSGGVTFLPISPEPPYLILSPTTIRLSGSGPNKIRQEGSHPHQAIIHPEYQELFVPDLGADRVCRFKRREDGSWKIHGHIGYASGGGPRHVAFYDGHLFTVLELSNKLVRHRLPPLPALPTLVASIPTMSQPLPPDNDMIAAEILIPAPNPSFPTPYLYLSNRNDPSPEGDIISIFAIENPDTLELVAEVRTGMTHVRAMQFGGPDDKYLITGGTNGGGVKVFERVNLGKGLKEVASNISVKAPTAFLWF